jgi:hypothetical protein
MNKSSYYKEITLQRYAQQKTRPLTPDSLLRRYAYPTEVFYGKTKQEFIDNNGEASNTYGLGGSSQGGVFDRGVKERVPLVLEPQTLKRNLTPGYSVEHGVIKAKLKNMRLWTLTHADLVNSTKHLNQGDQLRAYILGTYCWEFPIGRPLDDPRDYLFSYTLTDEIIKPNPKALSPNDSFEYYHIEIR